MRYMMVNTELEPTEGPWFVVMVEEGDAIATCGPFDDEMTAVKYAEECNSKETTGGVKYDAVPFSTSAQFAEDMFGDRS